MVKKYDYNSNMLDMFRLFATLQVFAGHVITHFSMSNPPVQAVYFIRGVPILFALCGFLAAMSLEKYSTKEYMVRRAVRIFPAFWVCILVNTVIILLVYDTKPVTYTHLDVYKRQLLNCISYVWYGKKWVRHCKKKFDATYVFEVSPVTVGLPAVAYKKKFGTPIFFNVQDLRCV